LADLLRLIYRFRQFWHTLRSAPYPEELEQVKQSISPSLWALFNQMQPAEQYHSIQVFKKLTNLGESSPELLTAALLHDVGKIYYPISLLERGMIVAAQALFPDWAEKWHRYPPLGWKRPFAVASCHPEWGAQAARAAGASPTVENLIRRHQEKEFSLISYEDLLLKSLQKADAES
jgi:hypothetical protein